jgi:hypothetical protein
MQLVCRTLCFLANNQDKGEDGISIVSLGDIYSFLRQQIRMWLLARGKRIAGTAYLGEAWSCLDKPFCKGVNGEETNIPQAVAVFTYIKARGIKLGSPTSMCKYQSTFTNLHEPARDLLIAIDLLSTHQLLHLQELFGTPTDLTDTVANGFKPICTLNQLFQLVLKKTDVVVTQTVYLQRQLGWFISRLFRLRIVGGGKDHGDRLEPRNFRARTLELLEVLQAVRRQVQAVHRINQEHPDPDPAKAIADFAPVSTAHHYCIGEYLFLFISVTLFVCLFV